MANITFHPDGKQSNGFFNDSDFVSATVNLRTANFQQCKYYEINDLPLNESNSPA